MNIRCAFFLVFFLGMGCKTRFTSEDHKTQISEYQAHEDPCALRETEKSGFFRSSRDSDGLIELPTVLLQKAFYYGCASQQFNFEDRTQPALTQQEHQYLLGIKKVPYWDIRLSDLSRSSRVARVGTFEKLGDLTGSSLKDKIRIFVHPSDRSHLKAFENRFGQPAGSVPGLVTSSFRTVLLLPPKGLPFLMKLSGSVVLKSHVKALLDDEVFASVARSKDLSKKHIDDLSNDVSIFALDHAGVLFSSEFIPGVHAISQEDDRAASLARVSDSKVNQPIYHQLFRSFYELDSLVQGSDDWILLAGHSLFSRAFLQTGAGLKFVGSELADQRRWLGSEVMPQFAKFIMQSVFKRGLHLEAHFQNIDFLIVRKGNERLVHVLYKDLADVVEDPVLLELLGRLKKGQEISWFGSWALGSQPYADIEKKYAGKFGFLRQSEVINENPQTGGAWAQNLHQALRDAYGATTSQMGLKVEDALLESHLNAKIYEDLQLPQTVAEQKLGQLLARMREHVMKMMLHKYFQKSSDQSSKAKLHIIDKAYQLNGKGAEQSCPQIPVWKPNIDQILTEYDLGDVQNRAASPQNNKNDQNNQNNQKMKALLKRGPQNEITCYIIVSNAIPRPVLEQAVEEIWPK